MLGRGQVVVVRVQLLVLVLRDEGLVVLNATLWTKKMLSNEVSTGFYRSFWLQKLLLRSLAETTRSACCLRAFRKERHLGKERVNVSVINGNLTI